MPRILIVDDEQTVAEVMTQCLVREGHQCAKAVNGQAALEMIRAERFDLVISDIRMPMMTGLEMLHQLQQDLPRLPVILVTAVAEVDTAVDALRSGAQDYVLKPFKRRELIAVVERTLEKCRLAEENERYRRELEMRNQELHAALADLRDLEKIRDDLTHMIIHDMRTPLMGILGGLELLEMTGAGPGDERFTKYTQLSRNGAANLLNLVNSLLDVTKMESGHVTLHRAPADMTDLIHGAVRQIQPLADEKGLCVDLQVVDELPTLHVDAEMMQRVMVNLLGNAIKFSPDESVVQVCVQRGESGLRVTVADTGPGVPDEWRERIFDKFAAARFEEAGVTVSTGIGLTYCKMTVEAHGGRIWVEPALDKGSHFVFELSADQNYLNV